MKKPVAAVEFARRRFALVPFLVLIGALAANVLPSTMTLTTVYPAPSGVYKYLITTNNAFFARDAGNVGIGTASPLYKLHVSGNAKLGVTEIGNALASWTRFDYGGGGANNKSIIYATAGNYLSLGSNGNYDQMNIVNGNVGIGTATPGAMLDVAGPVAFRSGAANGYVLTSDASGNAAWRLPSGGVSITAGNAGIVVSPSPLTGTGTISLATQGCPGGQALQSIGGTYSCVSVSGGSSGITLNGMTGTSFSIVGNSPISVTSSGNTVYISDNPTSSGVQFYRQSCTFPPGAAGWRYCWCPSGYYATGWAGYNCQAVSGWGCAGTGGYDNGVAFGTDGAATIYASVYCAK